MNIEYLHIPLNDVSNDTGSVSKWASMSSKLTALGKLMYT